MRQRDIDNHTVVGKHHTQQFPPTCTYFSFSTFHANRIQISLVSMEKNRKRNVKLLNDFDVRTMYPFHSISFHFISGVGPHQKQFFK